MEKDKQMYFILINTLYNNENLKVNCCCFPVALTLILHSDISIVDGCVGVSVYHSEGYLDKYEDIT